MYYLILNGPNLNLLGRRDPATYGADTFEQTLESLKNDFSDIQIEYAQSNSEGEIISLLHDHGFNPECAGIVLNPGAYAHYSHAIADAVEAIPVPIVEVHISNIHAREPFRQTSVTARAARGLITGLGRDGYALALLYLIRNHK